MANYLNYVNNVAQFLEEARFSADSAGWCPLRAKAVIPPNIANLSKRTFPIMVSADLDNLGGHAHHPCHRTSTRLLRRHGHADP
jgi:hypothetical protein